MIIFDIISIFPELFKPFVNGSLVKKAREKKLLAIRAHDLRGFARDAHRTVDDKPFGGGFGMVMKADIMYRAIKSVAKSKFAKNKLKSPKGTRVILLTPRGKKFSQKMAVKLAKEQRLVFVCGRYEGVDERVAKKMADLELSVGDYDLMGGEVAAMAIIETVARLIPGVIGKPGFLEERGTKDGFFESAQYTRPESFSPKKGINWRAPKELLSGDPKIISAWRKNHGKTII